jgi:hypothetical protein
VYKDYTQALNKWLIPYFGKTCIGSGLLRLMRLRFE